MSKYQEQSNPFHKHLININNVEEKSKRAWPSGKTTGCPTAYQLYQSRDHV